VSPVSQLRGQFAFQTKREREKKDIQAQADVAIVHKDQRAFLLLMYATRCLIYMSSSTTETDTCLKIKKHSLSSVYLGHNKIKVYKTGLFGSLVLSNVPKRIWTTEKNPNFAPRGAKSSLGRNGISNITL